MFSIFDSQMMLRAIELAKRGVYTTAPNPNVGCVVCQNDDIVGEGFHLRAGEPHAEVHALDEAGELAKGSTVYVTLEPCSHFGRTQPCADALINARVSRVVCAMVDPNPRVAGRGIQRMRDAGIQVDIGLLQEQAEALNPGFIKEMKTGLPYVQLKLAASLDGRTALSNGKSKWITGAEARSDVQAFRARAGAILSTSATVLADDPSLNVRHEQLPESVRNEYPLQNLRQPVRVILDRNHRVTEDKHLFSLNGEIIVVNASDKKNNKHVDAGQFAANPVAAEPVTAEQVTTMVAPDSGSGFELEPILRMLAKRGINHIWVEAGARLAGSLLENGLVDELVLYQAPKLMGSDGRALADITGISDMADVPQFELQELTKVGDDIRMRLVRR